jgi:hypothetical protein
VERREDVADHSVPILHDRVQEASIRRSVAIVAEPGRGLGHAATEHDRAAVVERMAERGGRLDPAQAVSL